MMVLPRLGKLMVVAISVGLHGLAGFVWASKSPVEMAGGAESVVQARLGSSFADLLRAP